ncbi:hypothetical protein BHM03_00033745 [Ensete ventricosum]|nr:hypothetical protein BHM03_00033745 [Ensete ventricosum]
MSNHLLLLQNQLMMDSLGNLSSKKSLLEERRLLQSVREKRRKLRSPTTKRQRKQRERYGGSRKATTLLGGDRLHGRRSRRWIRRRKPSVLSLSSSICGCAVWRLHLFFGFRTVRE